MDIDNIVNGIVESYEKYEDITKIDRGALINKNEVIKVIDLMQKILFPGFFEQKKLKSEYIKYYVGDICESIKYILSSQMVKVFRCSEDMGDMCHEQMQKKADDYDKQKSTMNDTKKAETENQLQEMYTKIQQTAQDNQQAFNKMQQEKLGPILQKVRNAIETVAKNGGYVYVMEKAAGQPLYVNETLSKDITAEVKAQLSKIK